ncbi:hypothetical protein AAVH_36982, partial [Aphelenchoides avenae]
QPLILEKDPFTQECKWFTLTNCEKSFFAEPTSELLKLVIAALYLDIPRLQHYACQAIAARIKDQPPADVRAILRQRADLTPKECADILARNPWLDPEITLHGSVEDVTDLLHIPSEVLVTIFEKLSRADLERLQFVNAQFRDVVLTSNKLGEELGPLRRLNTLKIGSASSDGHKIDPHGGTLIICQDHSTLVQRLKFCAECSDEALYELLPSKLAWKNATVYATTDVFSSEETFTFAFSELLFCKEIHFMEYNSESVVPRSVLRLPAMIQCNGLHIWSLLYRQDRNIQVKSIKAHDIVEWLEREDRKKWGEPRRLTIDVRAIDAGRPELIEALKKVFLAASRPNPYIVRIRMAEAVNVDEQYHENETTHEELHVRKDGDVCSCILVERK